MNGSPSRKSMKSPKKARPSTAVNGALSSSPTRQSVTVTRQSNSNISIIREINETDNIAQEKDIEIERLRTTCGQLAARVTITEDIENQNVTLKTRLAATEDMNERQQNELNLLRGQIVQLNSDNNNLFSGLICLGNSITRFARTGVTGGHCFALLS